MPSLTPAEKSAQQMHLLDYPTEAAPRFRLDRRKKTLCGITFRKRKFLDTNIATILEGSTCASCTEKYIEARENAKPKPKVKPAKAKKAKTAAPTA